MTQPSKIKVVFFDEGCESLKRFAGLLNSKSIINIAASFSSFPDTIQLFRQDNYSFFKLLSPDVCVVRLSKTDENTVEYLKELKQALHIKLAGLLSVECARNKLVTDAFDYYIRLSPSAFDENYDAYTHLLYQIKSARLALNNEKAGVTGKWVMLPPLNSTIIKPRKIIAIGASAGGTEALTEILTALPGGLAPILIVQHIPENFTRFFADNLAAKINMKVTVAKGGEVLENGNVYIAGNGRQLEIERKEGSGFVTRCTKTDKISGHCPSVDALFSSAAKAAGSAAVGVILTGMGSDGAEGLLEMRNAGALTIGQDKQTSAVYGMPMAAFSIGAVGKQLPLGAIPDAIIKAVSLNAGEETEHERD